MTAIEKIRAVLDSGIPDDAKLEIIRDVVKAKPDASSVLDALREFVAKQPKQVAPLFVPYYQPVPIQPAPWWQQTWPYRQFEITCKTQTNVASGGLTSGHTLHVGNAQNGWDA